MSKISIYKNSWVHYVTKAVVDIMFYAGIVACLIVPYLTAWLTGNAHVFHNLSIYMVLFFFYPLTIIFFLSGVCAVYILWQFKKLFKTLLGGNPFVPQNVNCFRKMAVASFLIAVFFIIRCIWFFTFASAVVVLMFALATLFCLTLKDIFKQAAHYKEENDWTV